MNTKLIIAAGVTAGVIVLGGAAVAVATLGTQSPPATSASAPALPSSVPSPTPTAAAPETDDTTAALLYIIEEEKLAHDVYLTLGDLWGSSIFSNITESETTHQETLAPLLEARKITDPRSTEVGVFTDPNLQTLYDELIARGSTGLAEAIQVGILIEEKDIVDLTEAIAAEDEADVISAYERLLAGSQNHLDAFQRRA